jgi:hypothetical protein
VSHGPAKTDSLNVALVKYLKRDHAGSDVSKRVSPRKSGPHPKMSNCGKNVRSTSLRAVAWAKADEKGLRGSDISAPRVAVSGGRPALRRWLGEAATDHLYE